MRVVRNGLILRAAIALGALPSVSAAFAAAPPEVEAGSVTLAIRDSERAPASSGQPLRYCAGDRLAFDLGRLPSAFKGLAVAHCEGRRKKLLVLSEKVPCEITFEFRVTAGPQTSTLKFQSYGHVRDVTGIPTTHAGGGVRHLLIPTDGVLEVQAPRFDDAEIDRAIQAKAPAQCGRCQNGKDFQFKRAERKGNPPAPLQPTTNSESPPALAFTVWRPVVKGPHTSCSY